MLENINGVTVRQLKEYVKDLEEVDANGDDYEVWVSSGEYTSNPVKIVCRLNEGDLFIG